MNERVSERMRKSKLLDTSTSWLKNNKFQIFNWNSAELLY